ncbi:MAG: serine hydrolase [Propionibacteriales bacterium]|nr:serine hydrolase [Propionibacteriales bacterium]
MDVRRQAVLDRYQGESRLPSVVGGTVQDGRLTWSGLAGDGDGVGTQYRIGSITKTVTAVLVLQCRDDGLLDLDDPVGRFIPETGYRDASVRSLLTHSSGMQAEPVGSWWERSPGTGFSDLVARNGVEGQVLRPGTAFHYSNLGFALLGECVARLRSADWWTLARTRLLEPLGMTRTTYDPLPGAHATGRSVGHFTGTLSTEPHEDTGAMAPAGQLWSTLADLALWLDFLALGRPGILEATSLDAMATPGIAEDYGLGLRLLKLEDGRRLVGHTGSMPGFLATAFVDRSTREGVVALANATTGVSTDALARALVVGQEPYDGEAWSPSGHVPERAAELLGLWFWGNTAHEVRWTNQLLELWTIADAELSDRFVVEPDRIRGIQGYLLGETLIVQRDDQGLPVAFECATFVFTRTPYGR